MFSSLRSRLWWSYALVITGALFVTAVILILFLVRSPLVYRQTTARMRAIETVILVAKTGLTGLPQDALESTLQAYDKTFNVRILIFNSKREVLADSRGGGG